VNAYLDASLVVALLTNDLFTGRAEAFLAAEAPSLILSDYAAAEFASVVARRVRMGELTKGEARDAFAALDLWAPRATARVETTAADIAAASMFIRRLDVNLRTPDAVNIAIVQRAAATLVTFDTRMAANAVLLGIPTASV
jgi:predicted nucleic acid-binding protein